VWLTIDLEDESGATVTYRVEAAFGGDTLQGFYVSEAPEIRGRFTGIRTGRGGPLVFTPAQASAGGIAFQEHCAVCHGAELEGIDQAPALVGKRFDQTWRGKAAEVLYFHLKRMPPEGATEPDSVSDETRVNILAYILASNGLVAGDVELSRDSDALRNVYVPRLEGVNYEVDAPVFAAGESDLLNALPMLTDEALSNPSADDWLHWGSTYSLHNFSPLDDINKNNVHILKPVWRASLRDGRGNPSPLVHQGVMYLHAFPDTVLALDASNGDVLWRHRYEFGGRSSKKMGIALYEDKVITPTSDGHLLALDAKTGELIWKHSVSRGQSGVALGAAPLATRNKVIQGTLAWGVPGGPFAAGLDMDSGDELWRVYSIARPGEEGGNSWNGMPLDNRTGGNFWHQNSYDPESNLVYMGPSSTYTHKPLHQLIDEEGVTNDALFTNSTLAIDADTGELVWYFQHLRNDHWNFDWAFERQITHLEIDGKNRKVVLTTGKMAITDVLDAATGEFLFSIDAGMQNIVESIDAKTGVKNLKPEARDSTFLVTPNHYGARAWAPTSYNPETKHLFLPLTEGAQTVDVANERGWRDRLNPESEDGLFGRVQAIDVANQKLAWRYEVASPVVTGVLATGGGVVFAGDLNRNFYAFDDATGELLWQAELDDIPNSNVISYRAAGKQHIAVVVGLVSDNAEDWENTYKDYAQRVGAPFNDSPKGGTAIWAFAIE
jgi:alcohol dehydrogenase (cytochrome c)